MAESNANLHRHINELIDEEHRLRANEDDVADAERRRRLARSRGRLAGCR